MKDEPPSLYFSSLPLIAGLLLLSSQAVSLSVILVILLICSALVSGSEVSFFSLTPTDFEKIAEEDTPRSKSIMRLRQKPRLLLATILVANNFINIAIVILSEQLLERILPEELITRWSEAIQRGLNITAFGSLNTIIYFLITVVGVTSLLVLFGEVLPKIYANLNRVSLTKFMAPVLIFLRQIFNPLTSQLVKFSNRFETRLADTTMFRSQTTKDDLTKAIDLAVESSEKEEIDLLKRIIYFKDVMAREIMTPRNDVQAVDIETPYSVLKEVMRESGFSRIPVYDEDLDQIKGMLYVKDFIVHLNEDDSFRWQDLIRPDVIYIPEIKKVGELLKEFQTEKKHISIVVDEFGGTSGLITLEDIMEEIVGEIHDEFDTEEIEYEQINDTTYNFDGKTRIKDMVSILGLDQNEFDAVKGDSDTIAGMMIENLGKFPEENTEYELNGITFKVLSANKRRLELIQIGL